MNVCVCVCVCGCGGRVESDTGSMSQDGESTDTHTQSTISKVHDFHSTTLQLDLSQCVPGS